MTNRALSISIQHWGLPRITNILVKRIPMVTVCVESRYGFHDAGTGGLMT